MSAERPIRVVRPDSLRTRCWRFTLRRIVSLVSMFMVLFALAAPGVNAQEDRVTLDFDKELTKGYENAKVKITSPTLYDKTIYSGYTGVGENKTATFKVKVEGTEATKGKIKLSSTRGGLVEREFTLNQ